MKIGQRIQLTTFSLRQFPKWKMSEIRNNRLNLLRVEPDATKLNETERYDDKNLLRPSAYLPGAERMGPWYL
ncbi:hypothetical protein WA026_004437 [Henosepilachna vigintioctopunctata]|uniref:Uncharacterized protein n=1 Tax=Henosepilachna vigintioctopunctata TaxID=420089 RepID=A0AAW1VA24_9CUCU